MTPKPAPQCPADPRAPGSPGSRTRGGVWMWLRDRPPASRKSDRAAVEHQREVERRARQHETTVAAMNRIGACHGRTNTNNTEEVA